MAAINYEHFFELKEAFKLVNDYAAKLEQANQELQLENAGLKACNEDLSGERDWLHRTKEELFVQMDALVQQLESLRHPQPNIFDLGIPVEPVHVLQRVNPASGSILNSFGGYNNQQQHHRSPPSIPDFNASQLVNRSQPPPSIHSCSEYDDEDELIQRLDIRPYSDDDMWGDPPTDGDNNSSVDTIIRNNNVNDQLLANDETTSDNTQNAGGNGHDGMGNGHYNYNNGLGGLMNGLHGGGGMMPMPSMEQVYRRLHMMPPQHQGHSYY